MILYTPLSLEQVLEGYESFQPEYRELVVGEAMLVIEETAHGRGRIVRLISPRAEDYLNPAYQPGEIVSVK